MSEPPRRMHYVPNLLRSEFQLRQREYLLRLSRAMTSRLDLASLIELILDNAVELMNCSEGLIAIWPAPDHYVRQQKRPLVCGYGLPEPLDLFEPLTEVLPIRLVPRQGSLSNLPDADDDYVAVMAEEEMRRRLVQVRDRLQRKGYQLSPETLWAPLHVGDTLIGVMFLFRQRNAFSPLDRQVLHGFVNQASIAVRNGRMYRELEEQQQRLEAVIENSTVGVMILDQDRYVVSLNQTLADLVGMTPEHALYKRCNEVLDLHSVSGFDFCQSSEAIDLPSADSISCEGEIRRPGAKTRTVTVTYTPLRDYQDNLLNVIVNVTDITRFKEEEEQKTTFVSAISHDLKTPVTVIKGNVELLQRPDAAWQPDESQEMLKIIADESDRLEGMINDLLDVSKVAAGALRLEKFPVALDRLLASVVQGAELQTDRHRFVLDFPAESLPAVQADEDKLRQVFANLVGNAVKYAPAGGDIRIGAWLEEPEGPQEPARAVVYVADQGIGIPESELDRIYQSFYRVDRGSNRSTSGTGLGLFLAKSIVEAHDGELWARSALGEGTTFFVALPVNPDFV